MRITTSLCSILTLLCPPDAAGQACGALVGVVVDDVRGRILAGATVSIRGTNVRATGDATGMFELAPVPCGEFIVRVELRGYATAVERIETLSGEVGLLQFRLSPIQVALEGLLVRARSRDDGGATASDVEHGVGYVATAMDLLRQQVPGVAVRDRSGSGPGIRIRGSSSLYSNEPALYVDGVLTAGGTRGSVAEALERIPGESIRRIRVLHGPAAAARFGDTGSGVILVEMR